MNKNIFWKLFVVQVESYVDPQFRWKEKQRNTASYSRHQSFNSEPNFELYSLIYQNKLILDKDTIA